MVHAARVGGYKVLSKNSKVKRNSQRAERVKGETLRFVLLGALYHKGKSKHLIDDMDVFHRDALFCLQVEGGKVEYAFHTGFGECVCNFIGIFLWDCEYGNVDVIFLYKLYHLIGVMNFRTADDLATEGGIDIEDGLQAEARIGKCLVASHGSADIARADDDEGGLRVDAENICELKQIFQFLIFFKKKILILK